MNTSAHSAIRAATDALDLCDNLPCATYRTAADGWTLEHLTRPIVELTGRPAAHYLGQERAVLGDFVYPDDAAALRSAINAALAAGRPFGLRHRVCHADGGVRQVEHRARPLHSADGKPCGIAGVLLQIDGEGAGKSASNRADIADQDYKAILEHAPVLINLKDLEGRYLFVNHAYERELGLKAAEMIGKSAHDFYSAGTADQTLEQHRRVVRENRSLSEEVCTETPQGKQISLAIRYPVLDESGKVVAIATIHGDLTRQKEAEASLAMALAELRDSDLRFRSMVANVPGVIYRCRFAPGWPMEFVCDYIEEITGYPPADFIGNAVRSFDSLVLPEDRQDLAEVLEKLRRTSIREAEYRIRHADGSVRWVFERAHPVFDEKGEPAYIDGVFFDVTEKKDAETALHQQKRQLHTTLESVLDAILTIDEAGTIHSVNASTERIFGWSAAELVGKNVKILMPEPYRTEHDSHLQRYLETGEARILGKTGRELTAVRKDGSAFPVELTVNEVGGGAASAGSSAASATSPTGSARRRRKPSSRAS